MILILFYSKCNQEVHIMATVTRNSTAFHSSNLQLQTEKVPYPVIDTVVTDEAIGALKVRRYCIACIDSLASNVSL